MSGCHRSKAWGFLIRLREGGLSRGKAALWAGNPSLHRTRDKSLSSWTRRSQFCPEAVNGSWPIAGSVYHLLTVAEDDYHVAASVTQPLKQGRRQGIRDEPLRWGKGADTPGRRRNASEGQRWALGRWNKVHFRNPAVLSDRYWRVNHRGEGTKADDSQSEERHGQESNRYGHATLHRPRASVVIPYIDDLPLEKVPSPPAERWRIAA